MDTNTKEQPSNLLVCGMDPMKGRWILVLLGLGINLCLGTIYSWSVFVKPLTDYFVKNLGQSVTANDILMPFSVFLAFFALAMPFTGKYLERYGPRNILIIGGVLTGLGWLLASVVTSVQMLYIVYGIIGGLGVGIAYGAPVAVAARWFPDRRGLAVGLTLLGFGFSAFLTANIAGAMIASMNVMNTFRIFGVAFIVLTILFALPQRFPPAGWSPAGYSPVAKSGNTSSRELNRGEMVKSKSFYALWFCFFIACLAGLMAISFAKPVGTEVVNIESGLATLLVGFFAIFNGFGRPVFGALTDRIGSQKTAILSFVIIALASFVMLTIPSVPVYIIAFAALWGCLGGWLAIAPTTTGAFYGVGDYPRCYGLVFLAYGAGAIVGPQLAGYIKTISGSYLGVFAYVTALAIIGIIIAALLLKPPAISAKTN